MYLRASVLFLICFCGYSVAQERVQEDIDFEDEFEAISSEPEYKINKSIPRKEANEVWWSDRSFVRKLCFAVAAGSFGLAVWQNHEAGKERSKASEWYNMTAAYVASSRPNRDHYDYYADGYNKVADNVGFHENLRNGFYTGTVLFGAAGIATWWF